MPIGMRLAVVMLTMTASAAGATAAGYARACYQAAEFNWPTRDGLAICTEALRDHGLSLHDRGALLVNRGIVQLHARRYAAALADYDLALAVAPGLPEALVNKGITLVEAGRAVEAIAPLTAAIAEGPPRPEVAYYTRGLANEEAGLTRAAYDDYLQARALAPDWTEPAEQLRRFSVVRRPTAAG